MIQSEVNADVFAIVVSESQWWLKPGSSEVAELIWRQVEVIKPPRAFAL